MNWLKKIFRAVGAKVLRLSGTGKPGFWMQESPVIKDMVPAGSNTLTSWYDGDHEFESKVVESPVIKFHRAIAEGSARVSEAWLFEAAFDRSGHMAKDRKMNESTGKMRAYRIRHVTSHDDFMARAQAAQSEFSNLPAKEARAKEIANIKKEAVKKWKEAGLMEDSGFGWDSYPLPAGQSYDPGQYTEFVPTMGGPFNKQLYLQDYLQMHAYAFEAWNHNPLAKRGVDIMVQYALGRRIKASFKDETREKQWGKFASQIKLYKKLRKWWGRELVIYGELMVDKQTWNSIDPSTIWDIITDPQDISKVYYYYQNFPTQYSMFTGLPAPGVPGAEKVPATEYIIRQLPYDQVMHIKINNVSNEKRGRSKLFPILGWLKRYKDLYNAVVIKEWINATFVWDYTIKGNAADVSSFASAFSTLQPPGSSRFHNEAVSITPMPAMPSSRQGGSATGNELLALIATAFGIPKEHFNLISSSGGNRATALVGSEPFTKVIEELQVEFEELLLDIYQHWCELNGFDYEEDDVEFVFPSVSKDTTSETVTNIQKAYAAGVISKRMMGNMIASELDISSYNFDNVEDELEQEHAEGLDQLLGMVAPAGRFGQPGGNPEDNSEPEGSDIHGQGKQDIVDAMGTL